MSCYAFQIVSLKLSKPPLQGKYLDLPLPPSGCVLRSGDDIQRTRCYGFQGPHICSQLGHHLGNDGSLSRASGVGRNSFMSRTWSHRVVLGIDTMASANDSTGFENHVLIHRIQGRVLLFHWLPSERMSSDRPRIPKLQQRRLTNRCSGPSGIKCSAAGE